VLHFPKQYHKIRFHAFQNEIIMWESDLSRWTVETITFYITYRWSKIFSVCRLYSVYNENLVTRKCEEIMWHSQNYMTLQSNSCSITSVYRLKKKGKERKKMIKETEKKSVSFDTNYLLCEKSATSMDSPCFLIYARFRLLKRTLTNKWEKGKNQRCVHAWFYFDVLDIKIYVIAINNKN